MNYKGTLIPVGGNEDKGMGLNEMYSLDFIKHGILSTIVKESGGINSKIVVITTASKIPKEVGHSYNMAFSALGCNDLHILDIRKRSEADSKKNLTLIEEADCLLFSGGDQSQIIKFISNSKMHDLLRLKLIETQFVIAGTSAGAMCMSKEMIAGGSVSEALFKGNVKMNTGMGFLPEAIIDSHFIQRGRFGRLAEAVAQFPSLLGIGLAEDTGLIIKNGNACRVIGSGMVILFDPSHLSHNKSAILSPGTPMSLSNLTTHVLAIGDQFTIKERSFEILPLEAELELKKWGY